MDLAYRFCKGECWFAYECDPQFYAQGFLGILNVRVIGKANEADCPITNRKFPSKGFQHTRGLGDSCGGVFRTDNPIEL